MDIEEDIGNNLSFLVINKISKGNDYNNNLKDNNNLLEINIKKLLEDNHIRFVHGKPYNPLSLWRGFIELLEMD